MLALLVTALGALLLVVAVVQNQFGNLVKRHWQMPPATKIKKDGFAYKTRLPGWATGAVAAQQVQLLRDGKPIGVRVSHASTIVEKGQGTYKMQREYIYFSLPGNEDPRPQLSRLALSLPRPVNPMIWVAAALSLVGGVIAALRFPVARAMASRTADRFQNTPATAQIALVFVMALFATLGRMPSAMSYSEGCFSAKGVPYTDAAGWDELSINLAEGRGFAGGFAAQRPLYPAMVALFYTVTGPSLFVAKALNALWLALAAAAVCAIGIKGGSRIAGLAGAFEITFGEDYVSFSKLLLTETSGVLYGAAAVLALAVALSKPVWWRIVLAALLLAIANLASGFGFFALIGYALVAFITWALKLGWWSATWRSAVLCGTVAIAWAPWIIRQNVVHGVNNLSTSSAALMYSTATSVGKWNTETASEWERAGVDDDHGNRYRFYMEEYSKAVKANPSAYLAAVCSGIANFYRWWDFQGPDHFGVVLLCLLVPAAFLFRHVTPLAATCAAAVVFGGCLALHGLSGGWTWTLATVLVLIVSPAPRRPLWALVAVGIPFVALLTGMTGGSLERRMWTCCEWSMPVLLVAAGAGAMRQLGELFQKHFFRPPAKEVAEPPPEVVAPSRKRRYRSPLTSHSVAAARGVSLFTTVLSLVLIVHAVVASAVVSMLYLANSHRTPVLHTVTPAVRAEVLAALRTHQALPDGAEGKVWMGACEFGQYICELQASENLNHWARSFEIRPYARSVAFARSLEHPHRARNTLQLRLPAKDIPRREPMLVIGMHNHDANAHLGHDTDMVEVLALVPVTFNLEDDTVVPDFAKIIWLEPTSEAARLMQAAP